MEVLAETEYQDVYRICDGVLLIVNKFLYKDYSDQTDRSVEIHSDGRKFCKTYNKNCQSWLKELKKDYFDGYANVTLLKGTVVYRGYPITSTNNPENYEYEIKTTGSALGGDYTELNEYLSEIIQIMKEHNGEE